MCDEGYFRQFGKCAACPASREGVWALTLALGAAAAAVVGLLLWIRRALPMDVVTIIVTFCQVGEGVGVLVGGRVGVGWWVGGWGATSFAHVQLYPRPHRLRKTTTRPHTYTPTHAPTRTTPPALRPPSCHPIARSLPPPTPA